MAATQSTRKAKRTSRLGTILSHAVLIAISIVALYPIYYMVITAFKNRQEYLSSQFLPPLHPTLQNLQGSHRAGGFAALDAQQRHRYGGLRARRHGRRRSCCLCSGEDAVPRP